MYNNTYKHWLALGTCLAVALALLLVALPASAGPILAMPGAENSSETQSSNQPNANFISVNSGPCAYNNFSAAIAAATPGSTVYIDQGTHHQRIGTVNKNLSFMPTMMDCQFIASGGVTIDADGTPTTFGGVIEVSSGVVVTLTDLALTDGQATNGGIAFVHQNARLVLENTDLSYGLATNGGGAVYVNQNGSLALENASIYSNTSQMFGGGIYIYSGTITAIDSQILYNTASASGGGIFSALSNIDLKAHGQDTTIAWNSANTGGGGGIYAEDSTSLILRAIDGFALKIDHNQASSYYGGGIQASGNVAVQGYGGVHISKNSAYSGGGISLGSNATLWLERSGASNIPEIWGNSANYGGGIYAVESSQVELVGANLGKATANNTASDSGGGAYLWGSHLKLSNTIVQHNHASSYGGGVAAFQVSTVDVQSAFPSASLALARVLDPTAPLASTCDPFSLPADHYCSEFRENSATFSGGGIYLEDSIGHITHTVFISNTSSSGAVLYNYSSQVNLDDSLLRQNTATNASNPSIVHVYYSMYSPFSATLNVGHTTIAGNDGDGVFYTASAQGQFHNNIIWGNDSWGSFQGAVSHSCNDTQDSSLGGTGDISADPRFVSTGRGAYHLGPRSPAIDACVAGRSLDLDNRSRPDGSGYDMGAFESHWNYTVFLPLLRR